MAAFGRRRALERSLSRSTRPWPARCCAAPAGKKSRQLLEESESEGEGEAPPAKRGKVGWSRP